MESSARITLAILLEQSKTVQRYIESGREWLRAMSYGEARADLEDELDHAANLLGWLSDRILWVSLHKIDASNVKFDQAPAPGLPFKHPYSARMTTTGSIAESAPTSLLRGS